MRAGLPPLVPAPPVRPRPAPLRRSALALAALLLPMLVLAPGPARPQEATARLPGAAPDAAAGDPDTVTFRLGGKLQFLLGGGGLDGANTGYFIDGATGYAATAPFAVLPPAAPGAGSRVVGPGTPGGRPATAGSKSLPSFRPADVARLYPGIDGVTSDGLRYGVSLTVGINNIGQSDSGIYRSPVAAGRVSDQPQLRQAYGYVASGSFGTVQAGATDGPSSLFMTGNFEDFNTGGWNGAVPYSFPRQWNTIWPFADIEAEYSTPKLVYLSPRWNGVDAAIAFEPSGNGLLGAEQSGCRAAPLTRGGLTYGAATQPGSGCDFVAGTPVSALAGRRDTVDLALRYRGQAGPLGIAAYAAYTGSASVHASGAGPQAQGYQGLQVGAAGAQVYYAGLTAGGMVMGGAIDNTTASYGLLPAGTTPQLAYLLGVSYAIDRYTIGAHYFSTWQAGFQTAATAASVGGYHAQGLAAGGTLRLRPGVALYLEYLWGQQRQNGYDLDLLTPGPEHNLLTIQYVGLGAGLSW